MNFSQKTWQDLYYDGELEYGEFKDEYSTSPPPYYDWDGEFKTEEEFWNNLD